MNMTDYVLDNLDPMEILLHYGFRSITESDDMIRACCEIHKGNNPTAFVWNKSNNLWFCHTGDCYGGDVFRLIEKMEHVDFAQAVLKAAEILNLNVDGMEILEIRSKLISEQRKWLEKQKKKIKNKSAKTLTEYQLPYTHYYTIYSNFSRFEEKTLRFYDALFCKLYPTEIATFYNKLVIPIYDKGLCVGVALRDTTGHSIPKWLYQPKGLKIENHLYNIDMVTAMIENGEADEVILVEGIFDVWAYHEIGIDNVVAIFGSTIKEDQYKQLLCLSTAITLSFDNDVAGNKCTQAALKKFKGKTDVKVIVLPEGYDPADCTHQELLDCYINRT